MDRVRQPRQWDGSGVVEPDRAKFRPVDEHSEKSRMQYIWMTLDLITDCYFFLFENAKIVV